LSRVNPSGALVAAERGHVADMLQNRFLGHRGSDGTLPAARARAARYLGGYKSFVIGENLAWGQTTAGTPSTIFSPRMARPPPGGTPPPPAATSSIPASARSDRSSGTDRRRELPARRWIRMRRPTASRWASSRRSAADPGPRGLRPACREQPRDGFEQLDGVR